MVCVIARRVCARALQWFFNESTGLLYLWYNGTGAPSPNVSFVVPAAKVLVNVTGSQSSPVVGLTFSGIGFRDTAYTYLDPHAMPSAGDWALERIAAVFAEVCGWRVSEYVCHVNVVYRVPLAC